MNSAPQFARVTVIGLGLIGSSIVRAVKQLGLADELVATDASPQVQERAVELNLADRIAATNAEAVKDSDLVIVCVPVGACGDVAASIGPHLKAARSCPMSAPSKAMILREMAPHLPKTVHFIPAHPVAGTEHSGPDAGFAELFTNRWCILTPPPELIRQRWRSSQSSGAHSAPMSRPWPQIITTRCSRSPVICRT